MQPREVLPSGKTIIRSFDKNGRVASESHAYGMLDIGISMEFTAGAKTGEMYFVNKKLVSRKRYEKARAEYADMPPPDAQLEDFGGELLRDMRAERQQRAKAAEKHVPDAESASQIDGFCESILATGKCADAESWIESKSHTLGEFSHSKSRNLIISLKRVGAKAVHACDIDCYDGDQENTGHLVVELPDNTAAREAVLREADRLVSQQGFYGDFDNGQRYSYIMLD